MNMQSITTGIIGIIIGVILTMVVSATSSPDKISVSETNPNIENENIMQTTMDHQTNTLDGKTGDDFDKIFIEEMIIHHQGAIEMAELAKVSALHDEIKLMADEIIQAQSSEIDLMNQWKTDWGY